MHVSTEVACQFVVVRQEQIGLQLVELGYYGPCYFRNILPYMVISQVTISSTFLRILFPTVTLAPTLQRDTNEVQKSFV